MALEASHLYLAPDVPAGEMASKIIKAIHTDTRRDVFPCDSLYGREWRRAIAYLSGNKRQPSAAGGGEKQKTKMMPEIVGSKVELPLEHPLEGRNNPQPSKAFMNWRVPSRFSAPGGSRLSSRKEALLAELEKDQAQTPNSRQHAATHTTHYPPPQGKFSPIKSEQQEHMAEVVRGESALRRRIQEKVTILPRLVLSAQVEERPLQPRTYSAAQRWLSNNPGQERLAQQVLRQCGRTEVDHVLRHTLEPDARKAVRDWLQNATESDREAAIKFFNSMDGRRLLSGPSGYRPSANVEGDKNARVRAVLEALLAEKGKAPARPNVVRDAMNADITTLMRAANRKHLRLLTPDTRLRQSEFQTWHHMPVYPIAGRADNVRSMYSLPNEAKARDFRIHPEWV